MIKQVKSVKVMWNDDTGRVPRFSFFKDDKLALAAIDAFCNRNGVSVSASRIWMQPVVKLLNVDCREDMEFYRRHAGRTCVDVTPANTPSAIVTIPTKPETKPAEKRPYFAEAKKPTKTQMEFRFEPNPKSQAAGRIGGAACTGRSKTKTVRSKFGTVMIAKMDQPTKRAYWRCVSLRTRQRKAGLPTTSWAAYKVDHPEIVKAKSGQVA